ncbi:MAG: NAD-dependent epimerase [Cyanobacteria bacterium PR.023]|nr:NAD-dependent epimerase [Cyanobacteria bacterium PR.023]MDP3507653.1 NAD-dependent epimerase/dehydratase family protein [Candidatus Melainabacteria bacterium]
MKALVTGGNGFIGAHLVDLLRAEGHEVRVFDRYPNRFRPERPDVEYFVGELGNHHEVEEAVRGIDWVFHLAYNTLPQTSNDDPIHDVTSNVVATIQLLNECLKEKVRKFVFVSSGGTVYGVPQTDLISEDHTNEPICSYGITKLAIEKYLHLFQRIHGLEYVVARFSNPYGELQNPNAKQGAIGVFLGHIAREQPIAIWGDGEVVRDYIYITDAVKALLCAAQYEPKDNSSPRIFNIGSGEGHSLNQIVETIRSVVGPHVTVEYTESRSVDVPINVLDIHRAKTYLNWQPEVPLIKGVEISWNWIKSLQLAKS